MKLINLENQYLKITCCDFGAALYRVQMPNQTGVFEDIALSYSTPEQLIDNHPYFSVVVGRVAGRIREGKFHLNGKTYQLEKNNKQHHLHGGSHGLSTQKWQVTEKGTDCIEFELNILSETDGYPGDLNVRVRYQLRKNALYVEYSGLANEFSLFDPTQHIYWNLSGNYQETIKNHTLQIHADAFMPLDIEGMVTDEVKEVQQTIFDLRSEKKVDSILLSDNEQIKYGQQGLDHAFLLNKNWQTAAVLRDYKSKRCLTVETDRAALVCYTANQLDDRHKLLHDKTSEKYLGICLETQVAPNAINTQLLEKPVIYPNLLKQTTTIYRFYLDET